MTKKEKETVLRLLNEAIKNVKYDGKHFDYFGGYAKGFYNAAATLSRALGVYHEAACADQLSISEEQTND